MYRIFEIIVPLKNHPETTEIKYPEESCRLLRLDVVVLTLVYWELCLFCQEKKHNGKERWKKPLYSKIGTQLKKT